MELYRHYYIIHTSVLDSIWFVEIKQSTNESKADMELCSYNGRTPIALCRVSCRKIGMKGIIFV